WVRVSEEEARRRGIWEDPRGGQVGVRDEMATPEELAARDKGAYDPRPASGPFVARRVRLRCARCGETVGHVDEYEKRILFHSVRTGRWARGLGGMKHPECYAPLETFAVDLGAVQRAFESARREDRLVQMKLGSPMR